MDDVYGVTRQATVLQSVTTFAQEAEPFTHIESDEAYQDALAVVSNLMETAEDDPNSPLNWAIEGFAKAIARYENQLPEVQEFEAAAANTPADIAMLSKQHGANTSAIEVTNVSSQKNIFIGQT